MNDDRSRELGTVLSHLVGRQVRSSEIIAALGVSRSAYYVQREAGRLVTADNLLRLAAALEGWTISPQRGDTFAERLAREASDDTERLPRMQAVNPAVVLRKISGGSRSQTGANATADLMSLAEFFGRYVSGALEVYLQAKRGAQSLGEQGLIVADVFRFDVLQVQLCNDLCLQVCGPVGERPERLGNPLTDEESLRGVLQDDGVAGEQAVPVRRRREQRARPPQTDMWGIPAARFTSSKVCPGAELTTAPSP